MSLLHLPDEILLEVTKDLGPKELSSLIKSSSRFFGPLTPQLNVFALKPKYRVTALYWAAVNRREDVVRLILEKGRNFVAKEFPELYGFPPNILHYASSRRFDEKTVPLILEKAASGTLIVQDDLDGSTPLHWAVRHGHDVMFNLLLEETQLLETTDCRGWTALHQAVVEENQMAVELLLKRGANANAIDKDRNTPIHLAARYGSEVMARMLLEHWDLRLNLQGFGNEIPFETAEKNGHKDIAKLILEVTNMGSLAQFEGTVLHLALRYGYTDSAKMFLRRGDSTTMLDRHGNTVLHMATQYSNAEMVGLLLDKGSDINARNGGGWTPLHLAVFYNPKHEVVEMLLKRGADVILETPDEDTALDLARNDLESETLYQSSLFGSAPFVPAPTPFGSATGVFGSAPGPAVPTPETKKKKKVKRPAKNKDPSDHEQIPRPREIPAWQYPAPRNDGGLFSGGHQPQYHRPTPPWQIADIEVPKWHMMKHAPFHATAIGRIDRSSYEWAKRQSEAKERGKVLEKLLIAYGAETDESEEE